MNIGFAVASVGGAALAGLLIAEFGIATALLVDAASFLAIAMLLALTRGLPERSGRARAVPGAVRGRHALRPHATRLVRLLLIGQAIALMLFTLIIPIEVIYAKESLGTSERRLRHPARVLGRRHRGRQPRLPARQAALAAAR